MNRFVILIILSCLGFHAQAQETQQFSLKQAQDFALQNAFSAKVTDNAIQQAQSSVNEQISYGLPQINGTADYSDNFARPYSLIPLDFVGQPGKFQAVQFGTQYNFTAGVSASQMLFDPTWIIGVQGAKMYVEKMRNLDKKNDQDLLAQIEQGYYTVLVAQRNAELLEKNLATLEKTFFETSQLFKNGFAEESAVDQLSLLVTNSKTAIDKAKRQTEITKNLLKFQMGYPVDKEIQLTDNLEGLWLLNNHEALVGSKFDFSQNINYRLADIETILNGYLVKIEKAKYLPTGTAFINYQTNAQRNSFDFFDELPWFQSAFWGVSLKMPIFDSFRKAASVKRSKLNLQRIEDTQALTEQQLKLEESTARSNYISAFEQLRAEEANIKLAEKIRDKTIIKFNEGIANSSELTQNENQLLSTQGAYINSLFELLNAKAELNKILSTY